MKLKLSSLRRVIREVLALETDDRMVGDDAGNGIDSLGDPEKIADHLTDAEDRPALGDPDEDLVKEIRKYFLQEADGEPETPTPGETPEINGFYTPFDMVRDHTGTDNIQGTWYRSPGRPAGGDGDPFRDADPYAQLGFHPPKGPEDPTASPPAADGEDGTAALDAPEDDSLKTDDTADLGANKSGSSVQLSNGSQKEKP